MALLIVWSGNAEGQSINLSLPSDWPCYKCFRCYIFKCAPPGPAAAIAGWELVQLLLPQQTVSLSPVASQLELPWLSSTSSSCIASPSSKICLHAPAVAGLAAASATCDELHPAAACPASCFASASPLACSGHLQRSSHHSSCTLCIVCTPKQRNPGGLTLLAWFHVRPRSRGPKARPPCS